MTTKKIISGLAMTALFLGAPLAFAQTTTTTGSTTYTTTGVTGSSSTTPGVPNTGSGGDTAQNLLLLGVSAVVALGGIAFLSTRVKYTGR